MKRVRFDGRHLPRNTTLERRGINLEMVVAIAKKKERKKNERCGNGVARRSRREWSKAWKGGVVWKKRPQAIFIQIPEPTVIIAKLRSSITHGTHSIPLSPLNSILLSDVILSLTPFARTACTRTDKTEEWSVRMRERKSGCTMRKGVEALFSALSRLTNEIHALAPQAASRRMHIRQQAGWNIRGIPHG